MASILKVDALQGITAAGAITVTSEGGAATQSLQQGLAKMWVDLTGDGTPAINKSLNTSGFVDNGTGDYTVSFTNNFDSGAYSVVADVNFTQGGQAQNTRILALAAGSVRTITTNTANAAVTDARKLLNTAHGDLA
jgi:hypothetical protein